MFTVFFLSSTAWTQEVTCMRFQNWFGDYTVNAIYKLESGEKVYLEARRFSKTSGNTYEFSSSTKHNGTIYNMHGSVDKRNDGLFDVELDVSDETISGTFSGSSWDLPAPKEAYASRDPRLPIPDCKRPQPNNAPVYSSPSTDFPTTGVPVYGPFPQTYPQTTRKN